MLTISNRFFRLYFCAGFMTLCWVSCAVAEPLIEWVTPPAWLQTDTDITPARPGMSISAQAVITTGRGGKAMVRVGRDRVQIEENSLWEWSGQDDAGVGNAVQGQIHVGTTIPRGLTPLQSAVDESSVRLYPTAPWALVLDVGESQGTAQTLVQFLSNSGYPVSAARAVEQDAKLRWNISLDGFLRSEDAANVGAVLMALAPGILSATPRQLAVLKTAPEQPAALPDMAQPALVSVAPKPVPPPPAPTVPSASNQLNKKLTMTSASRKSSLEAKKKKPKISSSKKVAQAKHKKTPLAKPAQPASAPR